MGPSSPALNDYLLRQYSQAVKFTAGGPSFGQTIKSYTGRQATSTTVTTTITLETVTTGKTYYMTDIFWGTNISAATQILDIQLQAAGVTIFRASLHQSQPVYALGIESQPSAASAQLVTILLPVTAASVVNFWYYVAGFEQ